MKNKLSGLLLIAFSFIMASSANAQYVDLTTGKSITIIKNQANGMMYNPETQRVVYLYINPSTKDTFYGRTGENINGKVMRMTTGRYVYNGDEGYVFDQGEFRPRRESDGYRKIFQGDGDVKLKGGDFKKKTEIDGDVKVKEGDAKAKAKADGDLKVKDGDLRGKIDNHGNAVIKDSTTKVRLNSDGTMKAKDSEEDYKGKVKASGKVKEKEGDTKRKLKNNTEKIKDDRSKTSATGDAGNQ